MKCRKCTGRVLLDRVFTENKNFEVYCIMCGDRKFIDKGSELGTWLSKQEQLRLHAGVLVS